MPSLIYIPILKTKAGDRWALSHLKPKSRVAIRPLLELHPHSKKDDNEHVPSLCDDLQAEWGTDRSFYLDGIWLHGETGHPAALEMIFSSAAASNLRPIPVVRPAFSHSSLKQISAIVEDMGRGYLLRISPTTEAQRITEVVEAIGVEHNKIDLLIDYQSHGMSLANDLPSIPNIREWRSLIAASGTFPRSLQPIGLNNWTLIPRHCWRTYSDAVAAGELARTPIFSDYTMRDPGAPADFGAPSVNLRYTIQRDWLCQIGGKVSDGASGAMHDFCAQLVKRDEFCGARFSDGDAEIERVADPTEGPGNPTQWIQWCVNHHIEMVVSQLT